MVDPEIRAKLDAKLAIMNKRKLDAMVREDVLTAGKLRELLAHVPAELPITVAVLDSDFNLEGGIFVHGSVGSMIPYEPGNETFQVGGYADVEEHGTTRSHLRVCPQCEDENVGDLAVCDHCRADLRRDSP